MSKSAFALFFATILTMSMFAYVWPEGVIVEVFLSGTILNINTHTHIHILREREGRLIHRGRIMEVQTISPPDTLD